MVYFDLNVLIHEFIWLLYQGMVFILLNTNALVSFE